MASSPKILVVDDHPINVALIRKRLEREGMLVLSATSGEECIQIARQQNPDLILLDVVMPTMDGLEACKILKADESTQSIPVIFLTATDTKEGMIQGLEVGGIDYLIKPVDLDETVARVRSQLRYQQIYKQNLELTERLSDSRRSAALGALSQGISHNLNNLLGVIYGFLGLAKMHLNKPAELRKHLDKIDDGISRMTKIIRQVTAVSTRLQVSTANLDPAQTAEQAVERFQQEYGLTGKVSITDKSDGAQVVGNLEILEDSLAKLLINAWESYCTGEPPDTFAEIEIHTGQRRGKAIVEFYILDRGQGLDPKISDNIFEPFVSTKRTVGIGMGLTIARHAIRNLNGEIKVEPRADGGVCARISLPAAESVKISAA